MEGKTVGVKGNVAGSSFNLMIGDAIPWLKINGQVTQDTMVGQTGLYTDKLGANGEPEPSSYGDIKFSR